MNIKQQIEELKKHVWNPHLPADMLVEMNRKYRELKQRQKKIKKVIE